MTRQEAPERGQTYAGRSPAERAADRRTRIMDAALGLFAARSYDDVTVADVCARARVSKRYFYEEFTDREDLLLALHRQENGWLLQGITDAAPKDPEDLDALMRPMLFAMVRMLAENPERARVIYVNAPRMERRRRGVLRRDAETFGRLARRALSRSHDKIRYERVLLAMVAGNSEVVIDWIQRGMTDDPDELAEHLTSISLALLRDFE